VNFALGMARFDPRVHQQYPRVIFFTSVAPTRHKVNGLIVLALAIAAWFVLMLRASAGDFYPKWEWILANE
jgi:hypothetical protein